MERVALKTSELSVAQSLLTNFWQMPQTVKYALFLREITITLETIHTINENIYMLAF